MVDDNCNGITDEGCDTPGLVDSDADGTPDEYDCMPTNSDIYPGALEGCNGGDDDCDGVTDEPGTYDCQQNYKDNDSDGYGAGAAS